MRKMLPLWTVSLTLTVALSLCSHSVAQQPLPTNGADWLRVQMAKEAAAHGKQPAGYVAAPSGNVTVGYQQDPVLTQPPATNVIPPETQIQISGTQTPGQETTPSLQPSAQPASPTRTIPELRVPNTSLQGVGTGVLPDDVLKEYQLKQMALPVGVNRDGDWLDMCACWQASGICHMPLYFEEPMLERHGQQRYPCLQPMISGVRFIGNIAMLPYYMQLDRPWEEQSVLGSYRPGTAAPALYHRPPYRADAVTAEGLATAAIFIAVP